MSTRFLFKFMLFIILSGQWLQPIFAQDESDSIYYNLSEEMEIERVIELRLRKLVDGFLPPNAYFLSASVKLKEDKVAEPLFKNNSQNPLLLFNRISDIKVSLALDNLVPPNQESAIAKAIEGVLKLTNGQLSIKKVDSNRLSSLTNLNDLNPGMNFPSSAQSNNYEEQKKMMDKLMNMEDTLSEGFDKIVQSSEIASHQRYKNKNNYDYPILYSLRIPLSTLLLGLLLLIGVMQYFKYKNEELEVAMKEAIAPMSLPSILPYPTPEKDQKAILKDLTESEESQTKQTSKQEETEEDMKEDLKIERNDRTFVEYSVATVRDKPNTLAFSRCVETMLEAEDGAVRLFAMFKLLGKDRSIFISCLSERTAQAINEKTKLLDQNDFNYEMAVETLHRLMTQYELELKTVQQLGTPEDLNVLANMDDNALVKYISTHDPLSGAMLLSVFPAKRSQQMLYQLKPNVRKDIYQGFSKIREFTPQKVGQAISSMVRELKQAPVIDGASYILQMLQNMGEDEARDFLSSVQGNEELSRSLQDRYITPNQLLRVDDNGIRLLFSEYDIKDVAHILMVMGDKITKIVMSVQNSRNLAILTDTLNGLKQNTKNRSAAKAKGELLKNAILQRLRELIKSREIALAEEEIRPESFYQQTATGETSGGFGSSGEGLAS